jgi:hypothetical protein
MCQNVIGSARTPRYLIVCRRSVIHFLLIYVRNKIHTCLYTILVIGFLFRKGVTWKSLTSHFTEMKTYVQYNIQGQKLDPRYEINMHIFVFTNKFYIFILAVYNDVHLSFFLFFNNRAFVAKIR